MDPRHTRRMKICFVCMGNICRSPTAEGVMRAKVEALRRSADHRARQRRHRRVAPGRARRRAGPGRGPRRGIELTSRARQVHAGDFAYFDLLIAMDRANHADLLDLAPDAAAAPRSGCCSFAPGFEHAPAGPDARPRRPGPYYGGETGFADVFDLIDAACDGLLAHVLDTGTDGHGTYLSPQRRREPSVEGQEAPGS